MTFEAAGSGLTEDRISLNEAFKSSACSDERR